MHVVLHAQHTTYMHVVLHAQYTAHTVNYICLFSPETAINIGYSCKLLQGDMELYCIDEEDQDAIMSRLDEMQKASEGITESRQSNVSVTPAYVFNGCNNGLYVLNGCNIWLLCCQRVQ